MLGNSFGRAFRVYACGESYGEALQIIVDGVPAGIPLTKADVQKELDRRRPGQSAIDSPRGEKDQVEIVAGLMEGVTTGAPVGLLIRNVDRQKIHVDQYRDVKDLMRPGHAEHTYYYKYGQYTDWCGAGRASGRETACRVAAGAVAKRVLGLFDIRVFAYVRELAGVRCEEPDHAEALERVEAFKRMRRDLDPFYQEIYRQGRITMEMRLLEKMRVLAEVEGHIDEIRAKAPKLEPEAIEEKYGVHPVVNCPDLQAARAMLEAANRITATGDSSGGVVEVVALGVPPGLGEPVFAKLDAELGRMLGIGAVKGVEVGAGFAVKDMTGSQTNDQMRNEGGKVQFLSNNAGGVTGGLATGEPVVVRLAVKPTPTIAKPQQTIDKYTLENRELAAITRRDPTIVARIWPVAEAYTAIALLDLLVIHLGYQALKEKSYAAQA